MASALLFYIDLCLILKLFATSSRVLATAYHNLYSDYDVFVKWLTNMHGTSWTSIQHIPTLEHMSSAIYLLCRGSSDVVKNTTRLGSKVFHISANRITNY